MSKVRLAIVGVGNCASARRREIVTSAVSSTGRPATSTAASSRSKPSSPPLGRTISAASHRKETFNLRISEILLTTIACFSIS